MLFQVLKSEIVSHLSYIVGSKNEAAVIDPRRDCQIYTEIARKWGVRIKYIFETHRNEDYVIGSLELSNMTGSQIFHGIGLKWGYGETIKDNQEFSLGSLIIRALHTPGHSPESTSFVFYDTESEDQAVMVFTGDLIFVGEVGRTDFLGSKMTPIMSGKMYDSIINRLLPLGESVIMCPAHGSGSVCGSKIKEREISTIGIEKATNPMLKLSKEDFIAYKIAEQHEKPPYFKKMEQYNLKGPPILGNLPNPPPLRPSIFINKIRRGAQIIDTRSPCAFGGAHIKNSYSLPPKRLSYVGWVLTYDSPILLVIEALEDLDFAVRSLVRLGFDRIDGYLAGGFESWYKDGLTFGEVRLISVQDLRQRIISQNDVAIIDVRRRSEWEEGHIEGSMHFYLGHLEKNVSRLSKQKPVVVICKTGNRSSLGASILLRKGFDKVYNCLGGIDAWNKSGFPLTK
jgi:hydroxyacylglutathione hydrolase